MELKNVRYKKAESGAVVTGEAMGEMWTCCAKRQNLQLCRVKKPKELQHHDAVYWKYTGNGNLLRRKR